MIDLLYQFHKELNSPRLGPEGVAELAFNTIARQFKADSLATFLWHGQQKALMMQLGHACGRTMEAEEKIHVGDASPFLSLLRGKKKYLLYSAPHWVLYVPMKWRGASESQEPLGVLRLERFNRKRPFSAKEKKLAFDFASELAQNLYQARLDRLNRNQLGRLSALTELTAVFASSLRVEDSLRLILRGIQKHFSFDRVRLYLVDKEGKTLRGELSVDIRGHVKNLRHDEIPLKEGIHHFANLMLGKGGTSELERYKEVVLYLPLIVQAQRIGLLIVDNLLSQEPIDHEDAGLLKSFAGQIALAVDNARLFEEVQELSLYDSLTQLPLRRYFFQRFQEEMYRAERFSQSLSLLLIDLDYFKAVNDTYGHQVGDQVLSAVSQAVINNIRKIDFPSRYGGDEILVLLPQSTDADVRMIGQRLLQEIRKIRVPAPFSKYNEVPVTVSMGVAIFPQDAKTMESLMEKADSALYWVKSHGKNNFALYQDTLPAGPEQRTLFEEKPS